MANTQVIRGAILHFLGDPQLNSDHIRYYSDGALVIEDGVVVDVGTWRDDVSAAFKGRVTHYREGLILPGFIDTHIHYPQMDMIASYGEQLFTWLDRYTYPTEKKFADKQHAQAVAQRFIDELLRNGTTTALTFATVHPQSVDALFEQALAKNMRLITGKVSGDRNLPDYLMETTEDSYRQQKVLIDKWHNKGRLRYAITPRFAPAVSPDMLAVVKRLQDENPDVHIHTHISESEQEVTWSKTLFETENYLQIYDEYNMLGKRTMLAHGVLLGDEELQRIAATDTGIAFCPSSNLFLGSGLFDLQRAEKYGARVAIGTDVGGGTSFSMLQTLSDAYKVLQLQKQSLPSMKGLYLATLGGALALDLDNEIGNFEIGKVADFVVLDIKGATPLLQQRLQYAPDLQDKLFALMMLGDDRSVVATYIEGNLVYKRGESV
ncbi:MAG: guanine deaminase [Gammaproteobacteria bacterium]